MKLELLLKDLKEGIKWGVKTAFNPRDNTYNHQVIYCHNQIGRNAPPSLTEFMIRNVTTMGIWAGELTLLYYVSKYFFERL